jgi:hypothetical protein
VRIFFQCEGFGVGRLCVDLYGFVVGGEATFFHFQPLFSIKRPSNATGPVLSVLISMLSVHLWWWFGLFLWFCFPVHPLAGLAVASLLRSHLFSRFSPRCQPLFSIKRLTNPTGPVLTVVVYMLNVYLWWWLHVW